MKSIPLNALTAGQLTRARQLLRGRVTGSTLSQSFEGTVADQATIRSQRRGVAALEDSAVLLTALTDHQPIPSPVDAATGHRCRHAR